MSSSSWSQAWQALTKGVPFATAQKPQQCDQNQFSHLNTLERVFLSCLCSPRNPGSDDRSMGWRKSGINLKGERQTEACFMIVASQV